MPRARLPGPPTWPTSTAARDTLAEGLRRLGASDPGYVLPKPASGKRQPMVQVALERYQRDRQRMQAKPDEPAEE